MTINVILLQCFVTGLIVVSVTDLVSTELVVNVKNQGGEIFQESFRSNVSDETVLLELQQFDGSKITQFIDFRNEIQIIHAITLGEEEQKESLFQIVCFVTQFQKTDFIPSDAMAKLRQKNPWALRSPERDMGKENVTLDVILDIRSSDWISPHIKTICSDAKDSTYGKLDELELIVSKIIERERTTGSLAENQNRLDGSVEAHELFLRAVKPFPLLQQDCHNTFDVNKACLCQMEICIVWYPCALKYCRSKDPGGKSTSYRCGIHTCKKCRHYFYSVPRRFSCNSLYY